MERQRKRRGTLRSNLTKFLNKIEEELRKSPEDHDILEGLLTELLRKEEKLKEMDEAIEAAVEESSLEEEVLVSEEYMEKISMAKCTLERHLRGETGGGSSTRGSARSNQGKLSIKLPRLVIEKFYGDPASWQNFWSQFSTSIHDNEALTEVEKFNYLRSFIGGAATTAISGLQLTDGNYKAAIEILKYRFGRRDVIVNTHMNNLLSITPVKKSTDLPALRKLYDSCEVQIRSLESLGIVSKTYSALLCPIIMQNLPTDIALELSRKHDSDDDWDLEELLKLLRKEIVSCLYSGNWDL